LLGGSGIRPRDGPEVAGIVGVNDVRATAKQDEVAAARG